MNGWITTAELMNDANRVLFINKFVYLITIHIISFPLFALVITYDIQGGQLMFLMVTFECIEKNM